MIDWGEPIFSPKDVLKQAARQGGATQEQIDWYDNASPEELKRHWDLFFEEVQKEINREVVNTICEMARERATNAKPNLDERRIRDYMDWKHLLYLIGKEREDG